jgi:hypothetical protein
MAWEITTTGVTGVRQQYTLAAQMTGPMIAGVFARRLTEAVTYARSTFRSAASTTPTATAVRTGALRAALSARVDAAPRTVKGTLGYLSGDLAYAGVQEGWPDGRAGTTIRPKNAQYLTIPLPGALTASGVPRGRARDFDNTFFARSRGGRLILFQRQGKTIVPLFLLVKEVYVPARPALRPTMDRYVPLIIDDLTKGATQLLRG